MRTFYRSVVGSLALLLAVSATSFAAGPQHTVSPIVLATTVADHVAQQDADRAAICEILARPEVKDVANKMGIDLARATATVATLDGGSLDQAAATARQVDSALAGGQSSVTISTTAVIIILLIVLVIIAVK